MPRTIVLLAVMVCAGLAWWLFRATLVPVPVSSSGSAGQAQASSQAVSATATVTAAATGPTPPPAQSVQEPAEKKTADGAMAVPTEIASGGSASAPATVFVPITGTAPVPRMGKPVAPVEVAWDLRVAAENPEQLNLVLTLTQHGQLGGIACLVTSEGLVELTQAAGTFPEVAQGAAVQVRGAYRLVDPARGGRLMVQITVLTGDRRVRTVGIEVPAVAGAAGSAGSATTGELITDNNGQRLILMPAAR